MQRMNRTYWQEQGRRLWAQAKAELRQQWVEISRSDVPVVVVAAAFAVGLLVSSVPIPMADMLLATAVMRRFSRLPRAPFLAAMALTNSVVMAPVYATTPRVGGFALHWLASHTTLAVPDVVALQVLIGYLLMALGLMLGGFVLATTGFGSYQVINRLAVRQYTYTAMETTDSQVHN